MTFYTDINGHKNSILTNRLVTHKKPVDYNLLKNSSVKV